MKVDRSIFSRDAERRSDLHLQLSEKYMIYKDYAERALINPQNIGKYQMKIVAPKSSISFDNSITFSNRYSFLLCLQ